VSHSVLVTPPFYDVVVVGAGPTGFTLAIDLGRRGIRTLLIEKDPSTKQWPKMDRSNARTMEFYRRLGFADRVRELGYPADASMDVFIVTRLSDPPLARLQYPTVAEHRAKIAATTDASEPLEPYQLVSQNDLEPLLKEIAEATPNVTVRFGCELVGFDQDDEGVDVHVRDLETGVETLRGSYLAGCDGGRSFVRRSLGIKLEGRGGLADMRQVTFRSEGLYDSIPIGQGRHYYVADELNSGFVIQGSRKDFTLGGSIPEDVDLEQVIRDRLGFDTDIEVRNSVSRGPDLSRRRCRSPRDPHGGARHEHRCWRCDRPVLEARRHRRRLGRRGGARQLRTRTSRDRSPQRRRRGLGRRRHDEVARPLGSGNYR
jgi:hypothetical protein